MVRGREKSFLPTLGVVIAISNDSEKISKVIVLVSKHIKAAHV